jgi:hypothetical protein
MKLEKKDYESGIKAWEGILKQSIVDNIQAEIYIEALKKKMNEEYPEEVLGVS